MSSIRETKPKKAKYAFEIGMSQDIFRDSVVLARMHKVLEQVPQKDRESEGMYWTQYRINAGTHVMTVYINDDALYAKLKDAVENEPPPPRISTYEHLFAAAKGCDENDLPLNADGLRELARDLFHDRSK